MTERIDPYQTFNFRSKFGLAGPNLQEQQQNAIRHCTITSRTKQLSAKVQEAYKMFKHKPVFQTVKHYTTLRDTTF